MKVWWTSGSKNVTSLSFADHHFRKIIEEIESGKERDTEVEKDKGRDRKRERDKDEQGEGE